MSGYVGDLSPQQEIALKQFKELVADVHQPHYDDHYYLRWLRAREFDIQKAETMMRKNLLFRRKIGADTILTDYEPPELIEKFYPRGYLGPDKDGCPVRFMPFKNLDLREGNKIDKHKVNLKGKFDSMKGFVYSVKKSEVLKFLTYMFEQDIKEMKEMGEKMGKHIEKHSYIVDVEGYSFRQATNRDALNMLNEVLKLYEANYPERMKTAYFINVPAYFNVVLNMSKPFLSENTLKKFRLYGKDFKKVLLNDIDAEILPKCLGGTRTDPDGNPLCKTIINYGGMIPPEYYVIKNNLQSLCDQEGVTNIKVPRQDYRLIEINVKEPKCKVEWLFETPKKDISVGFYFRGNDNSENDLQELIPTERVYCHLVPESGAFVCEVPGTYILKFDNTFSWISSKKVFYKVKVSEPQKEDIGSELE